MKTFKFQETCANYFLSLRLSCVVSSGGEIVVDGSVVGSIVVGSIVVGAIVVGSIVVGAIVVGKILVSSQALRAKTMVRDGCFDDKLYTVICSSSTFY